MTAQLLGAAALFVGLTAAVVADSIAARRRHHAADHRNQERTNR